MASNKRLNATITIGGAIASSLKTAFGDTQKSLRTIGDTIRRLDRQQRTLGQSINVFGRMGKNVDGLREKYIRAGDAIDRLRRQQERLNRALRFKDTAGKIGGTMRHVAARTAGAGLAIGGTLAVGVRAAIERENAVTVIRNSGVSKKDADAMIAAAQNSKQFGVSVTKATDTVSELRTALGTAQHAIAALPVALQAISGLKLYDRLHHTDMASGDSAYQIAKVSEERGGATDEAAMRQKYNWAFKAITGSNGKVTVGDLLTAVRSGKGAVQAMSDEAFFGDTFLQQSMGANRYGTASSTLVNAWIGGHQTHSAFDHMLQDGLLNRNGVKFDKTGKVKTVSPDALVDAHLFLQDRQRWVDKHLIPLAKRKGVNLNDTAALMKFVNAYTSNPNAANLLLSSMRFNANIWKDRRNVMQANDIDASDKANQKSTAGKMDNARARLNDAEARVGNVLIPAFATAMEKVAGVLETVNQFAEQNPTLMKTVVMGLGGLAAGLVVVSPLLVTAGAILQTIAMVRLARAASGVSGLVSAIDGVPGAAVKASSGILGFLGKLGMVGMLSGVALDVARAAGLPDTNQAKGQDDLRHGRWFKASMDLPATDFIKAVYGRLSQWRPNIGPADAPAVPPMRQAGGRAPVQVTNHNTFHINAHPGQSSKQIADHVMAAMADRQKQDMNSSIFDLVK